MMNQEKLVTVTTFGDYIEAELAKQTLEDFGIKSVITGGSMAMAYGPVPALMDLQLQVFESQALRAREILESEGKQEQ
ncbi:MAG: DUF2007 domain-containing protein [Phycisphaerae bacterium]|nr:DUF2007 domain-containing protein [Phycisphaerae bacterium]